MEELDKEMKIANKEVSEMSEDMKSLVPTDGTTRGIDLSGGIIPQNFKDMLYFAHLLHKSGLAPKSFDTPAKIAIGIMTNMEMGRPIITGMQDLAVINGRCGIYGDASLAMVTASGLMEEGFPISKESGTPYEDDWTFEFTVKRKGRPEATGRWTWAESKRSGFDNPQRRGGGNDMFSPWRRFTRRMMQWKSRNYVLRDEFGDVLRGMKTVEDLHDMDPTPLTPGPDGVYSTDDVTDKLKANVEELAKKEEPVQTFPEEEEEPEKKAEPEKPTEEEKRAAEKDYWDAWIKSWWLSKSRFVGISVEPGFLATLMDAPQWVKDEHLRKWNSPDMAKHVKGMAWPLAPTQKMDQQEAPEDAPDLTVAEGEGEVVDAEFPNGDPDDLGGVQDPPEEITKDEGLSDEDKTGIMEAEAKDSLIDNIVNEYVTADITSLVREYGVTSSPDGTLRGAMTTMSIEDLRKLSATLHENYKM